MGHTARGWKFPPGFMCPTGRDAPHPLSNCPLTVALGIGQDEENAAGTAGYQGYFNHFHHWEGPTADSAAPGTGGWIVTSVDTGAGAAESVDVRDSAQYGILRIQSNTADNDNTQLQMNGSGFKYVDGQQMWFGIRIAPEDADDGEIAFGLILESDTDMLNTLPADGLFFEKTETATKMDFHARKNGTSTEVTGLNTAAMADDTMHTYQFYVDPSGGIWLYYDGDQVGVVAAGDANLPTDEDLTIAIQVQTGAAAARYVDIDWLYCYVER